ncbi:MAG: hypothetical protein SPH63_06975 [Candidatus Cryptobacteroides sp.]|nr:hypothetical protein [Candidatus Cryptobacteroides sp.]
MDEVQIYYLKCSKMTEEHKRKISESMKRHYSTHKMSPEHRRKISEGMKKAWRYWKQCWKEEGLI